MDCRASEEALNAGPLDRFRAAANGHVAWSDVAAFTLLALLVLRVLGALLLEVVFPRAPTFVIDLVDNYTPLFAAVIMLLLVSREGLRGSLGPLGPGRLYVLAVLIPAAFTLVAALVAAVVGSGRLVTGTDKPSRRSCRCCWPGHCSACLARSTAGVAICCPSCCRLVSFGRRCLSG
jgi:hypothetical protein